MKPNATHIISQTEGLIMAALEERMAKIDVLLDMAQRMLEAQQATSEGTSHALVNLHDRVTRLEAWITRQVGEW